MVLKASAADSVGYVTADCLRAPLCLCLCWYTTATRRCPLPVVIFCFLFCVCFSFSIFNANCAGVGAQPHATACTVCRNLLKWTVVVFLWSGKFNSHVPTVRRSTVYDIFYYYISIYNCQVTTKTKINIFFKEIYKVQNFNTKKKKLWIWRVTNIVWVCVLMKIRFLY